MTNGVQATEDCLGIWKDRGFTLEEPDDHTLILRHEHQYVAKFNQTTVTPRAIRRACGSWLCRMELADFS